MRRHNICQDQCDAALVGRSTGTLVTRKQIGESTLETSGEH